MKNIKYSGREKMFANIYIQVNLYNLRYKNISFMSPKKQASEIIVKKAIILEILIHLDVVSNLCLLRKDWNEQASIHQIHQRIPQYYCQTYKNPISSLLNRMGIFYSNEVEILWSGIDSDLNWINKLLWIIWIITR